MKATYMFGTGDVRIVTVPDPVIQQPTDAIVRVTRACVCGSDLHPNHSMPASAEGTPMGHELIGVVEQKLVGDVCPESTRQKEATMSTEMQPKTPTAKGPEEWFDGDVYFNSYYAGVAPSRARLNLVRFTPGARTAWHKHAVGQTLHVTEGLGYVQSRGEELIELHPGDTVYTPAGEWHWHGATADDFMCHLALWEAPAAEGEPETVWGDKLTADEDPTAK